MCRSKKKSLSYKDKICSLVTELYFIPPKDFKFSSNDAIAGLHRRLGLVDYNFGIITHIICTIYKKNDNELIEWSRQFHSFVSANEEKLNGLKSYNMAGYYEYLTDSSRKTFLEYINCANKLINELSDICSKVFSANKRDPHEGFVFIVHGHDEHLKNILEKGLKRNGYSPIILSKKNDSGISLFDKFEKYANICTKAIILMTKDDFVSKGDAGYYQARPNVLIEFGYFLNMFEKKDIVVLLEKGCTKPSDVDGVSYIEYEKNRKDIIERVIDSLRIE